MQRAIDAELIDHFGWSFAYLGTLTERQVHDYCFHLREKETGAITRPKHPGLLAEEEHVARYLATAGAVGTPDEVVKEGVARIRAIHAKRRGEDVVVPPQKAVKPATTKKEEIREQRSNRQKRKGQ